MTKVIQLGTVRIKCLHPVCLIPKIHAHTHYSMLGGNIPGAW